MMKYIHNDLSLSNAELDRVRKIDTKSLLRRETLILVLDLDHTLLHTTKRVEYPTNNMEEGVEMRVPKRIRKVSTWFLDRIVAL